MLLNNKIITMHGHFNKVSLDFWQEFEVNEHEIM